MDNLENNPTVTVNRTRINSIQPIRESLRESLKDPLNDSLKEQSNPINQPSLPSLQSLQNQQSNSISLQNQQSNSNNNFIGVLSDTEIKYELKQGNIIIYDPNNSEVTKSIQPCSVDVTLGKYYYRSSCKDDPHAHKLTINPWNTQDIHRYWGKPIMANKSIIIAPGETILAHTNEFIGGRKHITTMMRSRSSLARCCISVCGDAGWGDIGYYSRWNMQITNKSLCQIELPINARVAQIIFMYTGVPEKEYSGKYQVSSVNVEEMAKKWTPNGLLPQLHKDK